MKLLIITTISIFICLACEAQEIKFTFLFQDEIFKLNEKYEYQNKPISFSACKFYVSNIRLMKADTLVKKLDQYFLFDVSQSSVFILETTSDTLDFDHVVFSIGVDSTKSVSGAFGGDLDPTNGMYWSWQSGYINFKIEGTSTLCPTRKNKFQFHLGGYSYPYNALQNYSVACTPSGKQSIAIAIDQFMNTIDLGKEHSVMSPGLRAVELSKSFTASFKYEK